MNNASSKFKNFKSGKLKGRIITDYPALEELCSDPDGFLKQSVLSKDSRSTTAGIVTLSDGSKVFVKRYNKRGFIHRLKYRFRRSRPKKVLKATARIKAAGIRVPAVLGTLKHNGLLLAGESYLIIEAFENIYTPQQYIQNILDTEKAFNHFTDNMAEYCSWLHNAGIVHGDLKISNVFFKHSGKGCLTGLWDFDGCRIFNHPVSLKWRLREIARLISSIAIMAKRPDDRELVEKLSADLRQKYKTFSGTELPVEKLKQQIEHFLAKKRLKS